MTFVSYDDPNREAIGLAPIWTGAEAVTPKEAFDPNAHTVVEVEDYLRDHPEDRDRVLAAESAGRNRTSLTGTYSEDDVEGA